MENNNLKKAIVNYPDGNQYYGEYNKITGKKEGTGVFIVANKSMHIGSHKNGQFHGPGVYYYKDGGQDCGNYLENKLHGAHIYIAPSGEKSENIYEKGKLAST